MDEFDTLQFCDTMRKNTILDRQNIIFGSWCTCIIIARNQLD